MKKTSFLLSLILLCGSALAGLAGASGLSGAPERASGPPGDAGVSGYICYSDYWDFIPQWVTLTGSGFDVVWDDPDFGMMGEVSLEVAWVRQGRLCGYAPKKLFGQIMTAYYYKEYDLQSGQVLKSESIDFDNTPLFMTAAYSPESDTVIGFGIDEEGEQVLLSVPGSNPLDVTKVATITGTDSRRFQSMTWNAAASRVEGINTADQLVALDAQGNATVLGDIDGLEYYEPYYTGLCYDASNRVYYWNITDGADSKLLRIDSETLEAEEVTDFSNNEIFSILWCDAKAVEADAPGEPEVIEANFDGPSPNGTVKFRLPTLTSAGESLSGTLDWTSTLDGATWDSGNGAPGAEVTVSYTGIAEGEHTFGLYASQAGNEGAEAQTTVWVGNDDPSTPVNIVLTTSKITWEAVTTGAHGGYVDPTQMSYIVTVNGETVGTTTSTSLDITLDADREMHMVSATVTAVCNGRTSTPGLSNEIAFGAALELPLSFRPTEQEFLMMTTSDDNHDGYGWHYVGDVTDPDFPCLDSDYSHEEGPADDWVFLPAAKLTSVDDFYYFTMEAKGRKTQMQPYEYFEVKAGKSPEASAMTETLIGRTLGQVGFVQYSTYFQVPEAGDWYIGIHAISEFDMYGVRVRDITLSRSDIAADSPGAPTQVSATAAPMGELSANVSFRMPTSDVRGNAYPGGTTLKVVVSGDTQVEVEGAPGSMQNADVRTIQGDNKITLTPYNGTSVGLPATVNVYTGLDRPVAPPTLSGAVSADNMAVDLTWSVPEEGTLGGYIDPAEVAYEIYVYNGFYGWVKIDEVAAGVTSYRFEVEDDTEEGMATYRLGVNSVNAAGASDLLTAYACVLGHPYPIPLSETFDTAGAQIGPWRSTGADVCTWGFADLADISYDWTDLPGGALVGMPKAAGTSSIIFPKFITSNSAGDKVYVKMRVWAGGGSPAKMEVRAYSNTDTTPLVLGEIGSWAGWAEVEYELPASLLNNPCVTVDLMTTFTNLGQLCVIDSFEVSDTSGIRLSVAEGTGVKVVPGGIEVYAATPCDAYVYGTDGMLKATAKAAPEALVIPLQAGSYIVKIGGKSHKIQVH